MATPVETLSLIGIQTIFEEVKLLRKYIDITKPGNINVKLGSFWNISVQKGLEKDWAKFWSARIFEAIWGSSSTTST